MNAAGMAQTGFVRFDCEYISGCEYAALETAVADGEGFSSPCSGHVFAVDWGGTIPGVGTTAGEVDFGLVCPVVSGPVAAAQTTWFRMFIPGDERHAELLLVELRDVYGCGTPGEFRQSGKEGILEVQGSPRGFGDVIPAAPVAHGFRVSADFQVGLPTRN